MKKTLLSLALIAISSSALATEHYSGRLSGMAGAGYVTGGYSDGVLLNPSLAATYKKDDNFAFATNGGGLGSDQENLVDGLDDLADFIDYLDSASSDLNESDAEELQRLMAEVDEKIAHATASGSLVVAIPNSFISLALVAKVSGAASAFTDIDESDYELIDDSIDNPFDPNDLQSSVLGHGVIIEETGIALAKNISSNEDRQILIGITPKRVEVETFIYEATVANFDEDDFDADDYSVTDSASSFDTGITVISGSLRYGLSISNVSSQTFKTITDETFELATRTTAAIGYSNESLKAEAAIDLDAVPTFGLGGDSQMFRAGIEFSALSWLQLRAGIQRDLEDTMPDTYTVGLGFSPFDVVNLDLAAFSGSDEAVGAALQLGLRF